MNPFIVMVIGAILGLKRVCPKCNTVFGFRSSVFG